MSLSKKINLLFDILILLEQYIYFEFFKPRQTSEVPLWYKSRVKGVRRSVKLSIKQDSNSCSQEGDIKCLLIASQAILSLLNNYFYSNFY